MAINEYGDFVLVADEVEKNASGITSKFTIQVFDSPVGQGEVKETVTLPGDLIQLLRWLEARKLDDDLGAQIKVGETLAGLLLPAYARQMFSASLARLRDGQGLRLRLRLADELADFPWEYIYIQEAHGERTSSGFLALDPRVSIVRHEAVAVPGDWFEAPSRRRVVVAMASPAGYPKLENLAAEQASLRRTLSGIQGLETVFLPENLPTPGGIEQGATLKGLTFALMERSDVFHFSGHGEFATQMGPAFGSQIGQGGIVLADPDNRPSPASAEQLAEMLRGKGVRLVVLGACETGRRDGINVWSGVAAALLKAGIPAVVAMQYTVNDTLAAAFSEALYRGLVAGFDIDEAVSLGRAAMRVEAASLQMNQIRDWCVPVLYLRSPGGKVFNPVKDTAAVQASKQKLGTLIEQRMRTVDTKGRVLGAVITGMQSQAVTVKQKVDEDLAGVMIGAVRYGKQGGKLVVEQKADTVSGLLIGGIIGDTGDESGAIDRLQQVFRLNATPDPSPVSSAQLADRSLNVCPECRTPNTEEAEFCQNCGAQLKKAQKFCAHCGQPLGNGAKFCGRCGTKVIH
jgi:hypothetical protein